MITRAVLSAAVLMMATTGCEPVNSPWMFPGQNCISCHNPNGQAFGRPWTVGGTIFDTTGQVGVEGAQVVIKDARGQVITLTTNGAGNFYTAEDVEAPFEQVWVGYGDGGFVPMPMQVAESVGTVNGACNYCHNAQGPAGIPVCAKGICTGP